MARKKRKQQPRGYRILERNGKHTAQIRIAGFKSAAKTFEMYDDAEQWAVTLIKELRDQKKQHGGRKDLAKLTIGDLNRAYLEEPDVKAQKSFVDTQRLLDWWTNKFGNVLLIDFGVLKLREEARPMLLKGRGNATVNRYLSALRSAWNWARDAGYVMNERAWPRRLMLTEPRGIVRFLSDEERVRMLDAALADPVIRAAVIVDISTGFRKGELLSLRWKDIDLKGAAATIRDTKNGETKVAHLIPEAVEALEALKKLPVVSLTHPFHIITVRKAKPKNALEHRWREVRKAAKLDSRFRFHDLRHTCASYLAQAGASDMELRAVLGHKTASMVIRYAHLRPGAAVRGHAAIGEKLRSK
jgi:integrase